MTERGNETRLQLQVQAQAQDVHCLVNKELTESFEGRSFRRCTFEKFWELVFN